MVEVAQLATNVHNEITLFCEAPKAATPERHEALLAAIVEGTDDAIISKDLNGSGSLWKRLHQFGFEGARL